jgi:hypothetical protein
MEAGGGLAPSVGGGALRPPRRPPVPALPGCLASPVQGPGQRGPALGPAPVGLGRVALGQVPSLPARRRGGPGLLVLPSAWLPVCGRFVGTRARSDALPPCVMVGAVRCTMRAGLRWTRPEAGSPESRSRGCRACQGAAPPPGACTPGPRGVPAGACRVCGARRHPGLARWRGSLPGLHVPLSPLHGPRYRSARMTRSQCGWLDLHGWRLPLLPIVPVCLGTPERQA